MPTVIETKQLREAIILPVGITTPAFVDKITKGGENTHIEEAKFYMRPLLSRKPVIDGEAAKSINPEDDNGNNVEYQWEESNVSTEGEFMAWWWGKSDSIPFETPEFPITFSDHGPGVGIETGGIVDGISDHMPITLQGLKNDPSFGERRLQKYATLVQIRVTGTYVRPDEEITNYSLPLLDYFSKRVALELCTPGIDYWGRQHRTITAQSPFEISSFPDMIAALEKLRDRLKEELEQDWRELAFLVPSLPQRKAVAMPASSVEFSEETDSNGELIRLQRPLPYTTKNPALTQHLETGWVGAFGELSLGFYPGFA